jgi:hypothetical protein
MVAGGGVVLKHFVTPQTPVLHYPLLNLSHYFSYILITRSNCYFPRYFTALRMQRTWCKEGSLCIVISYITSCCPIRSCIVQTVLFWLIYALPLDWDKSWHNSTKEVLFSIYFPVLCHAKGFQSYSTCFYFRSGWQCLHCDTQVSNFSTPDYYWALCLLEWYSQVSD